MDEIKRYYIDGDSDYHGVSEYESVDGEWCKHADYVAIVATIIAERDLLQSAKVVLVGAIELANAELDRLRELLARSREAMASTGNFCFESLINEIDAALAEVKE